MISLTVQKRTGKVRRSEYAQTGTIPAVFYGRKTPSTPISVSQAAFLKVFKTAGESSIITLKAGDEEHQAIINDVALDPVHDLPIHIDFYIVEKDRALTIKIPIEFSGTSSAVKDLGGILVKVLHELTIEALPKDLPHRVEVDISTLTDLKSQILAKDIKLGHGVTLKADPNEVVAAIAEAKEEEEAPAAPVDLSTIEVEKKGKEAKEGEEGAAEAAPEKTAEKPAKPEAKK